MESKQTAEVTADVQITAFNRTSMESKPKAFILENRPLPTFNRTSMESKHLFPNQDTTGHRLLIEPVWNRNVGAPDTAKSVLLF